MLKVPLPLNENDRQAALQSYHILDTATEKDFDDLAELASAICDTPIALIGFIDDKRHWFKARKGTALTESGKDISFCAHVIADPQEIMVVPDASLDPRFAQSPVVTGMNLNFYAGVPLINQEGFALGTLCVLDQQARQLTTLQESALKLLGRQVMDKLELRRKVKELKAANSQISQINEQLKAYKVNLQGANQAAAIANEELATSNAELAVINEELQSTVEELDVARQQAITAREMLDQAISSARIGTWHVNPESKTLTSSARLKELFGYHPDEEMPYDAALAHITGGYREAVAQAVDTALAKGDSYDLEYPVIGYRDEKLRWVRTTGRLIQGADGIRSVFSGTVMDITEFKEDEQRKNDFIGMVSHELKTPLTSMNGYIQMLLMKARRSEDNSTVGTLDKANKQVAKMTTIINGFLNVSRLESGKIYIDRRVFDMAGLVIEAEEDFLATIATHKVVFAPVAETLVNADRDKIGQVINNFISNAIKYSPPDTTIQVTCVTKDGKVQVSVQDEGDGIGEEDQEKLFERYYRVKTDQNKSIAGFGIGLYLCKEIIDRHKGQIGVRSKVGAGSIFWFTLPVVTG
jgi:PAS domain S-box-containing protein